MSKAAAVIRTRAHPHVSGGITSSDTQGLRNIVSKNGQAGSMSSFETWPAGLDGHLRNVLGSARGAEREAISSVRALHPELPTSLIWSRIVYLGLTDRKRSPYRKHEWTAEEDEILRSEYGRSRASSHDAIEKILAIHPDWSRNAIIWRARTLGLTQHRTPYQRWSSTLDHYLLSLMDCQLDTVAKRLRRSKKSVLARLRQLGWSAEFFGGFKTKDLVLDLRVTEAEVNRWVRLGWLERKKGRITEESFRWLCRYHPDAIPFETLTLEAQNWLRLSMDYGRGAGIRRGGRKRKNSQSEALSTVRAEMAG
jgi:hypothetical protein